MRSSSYLFVVALAGAMGCASAPAGAPAATSRQRDIITLVELENSSATNLHEAIQRLRPTMLRSRGRTTEATDISNFPRVYLDGQSYGDVNSLQNISVPTVREVRFINSSDATTRYGMNHSAGVVEVTSKR